MQTEIESVLTPLADVDARRALIVAAKDVIKFKISQVAPAYSIATQNYYTWVSGKNHKLSDKLQFSLMEMYGFYADGRLLETALHAWEINGAEGAAAAKAMLTYENDMVNIRINPAYTHVRGRRRDPSEAVRCFIGVSVQWWLAAPGGKLLPRRLIMAIANASWTEEGFMQWVSELFASKAASGQKVEFGEAVDVAQSAAEAVWRWNFKPREADGSRPRKIPNKGLLPFDQDIIGKESAAKESALSVLQEMAPRFKRLAEANASHRESSVSTVDLSLIRRATAVIEAGKNK